MCNSSIEIFLEMNDTCNKVNYVKCKISQSQFMLEVVTLLEVFIL